MAGETTSIVTVSQARSGPFAARIWRAKHIVTLIDKGHLVWTTNSVGHIEEPPASMRSTYLPDWVMPGHALAVVLAATVVRTPEFLLTLDANGVSTTERDDFGQLHCILDIPGEMSYSPAVFPLEVIREAIETLRGVVRLGVTRLTEHCPLDDQEIAALRQMGLEIDLFLPETTIHGIHDDTRVPN